MASWKTFEKDCFHYLVNTYGSVCSFEPLGQSDSTHPDVKAMPFRRDPFYIETKEALAQCGQFVLIPKKSQEVFEYSPRNKTPLNSYSRKILDYMNGNFHLYADPGTKGVAIPLSETIFYGWIKQYYAGKGVRFFITKGRDHVIVPIEKFQEYFSVSADYRTKNSGSTDPTAKNMPELRGILSIQGFPYELFAQGGKTYVKTTHSLGGMKLPGEKYTYLFNLTGAGIYNIRRLSNTKNANVIFSIALKKEQDHEDLQVFQQSLI